MVRAEGGAGMAFQGWGGAGEVGCTSMAFHGGSHVGLVGKCVTLCLKQVSTLGSLSSIRLRAKAGWLR